jgi:hypothetical protein
MDFLSRGKPALPLALFTKGVDLDVSIADAFPCTAVSFVGCRVALMFVVISIHSFLVFSAVLPVTNEPTAAGVRTGSFRLPWHFLTSILAMKKAPADFSTKALDLYIYLP